MGLNENECACLQESRHTFRLLICVEGFFAGLCHPSCKLICKKRMSLTLGEIGRIWDVKGCVFFSLIRYLRGILSDNTNIRLHVDSACQSLTGRPSTRVYSPSVC